MHVRIHTLNADKENALCAACHRGDDKIIEALVSAGARVNDEFLWQRTPLMMAAESGGEHSVRVLLQHGAYIDSQDYHLRSALHCAIMRGRSGVANVLLMAGANPNMRDSVGMTPLMRAITSNQHECTSIILEFESVDMNARAVVGAQTALHMAVTRGAVSSVKRLIDASALNALAKRESLDIDAVDVSGQTALMMAHSVEIVDLLLGAGANVHSRDPNGRDALSLAAERGHAEIVQSLLEGGANASLLDAGYKWSAIFFCCKHGHAAVIESLKPTESEVNVQDLGRCTPLFIAANRGHALAVKSLLARGADPTLQNRDGWLPLHAACSGLNRSAEILEMLVTAMLSSSAGVNELDRKDKSGNTALLLAAQRGFLGAIRVFANCRQISFHSRCRDGRNAAHWACTEKRGDLELFEAIVAAGAEPFDTDFFGWTCVHFCAKNDFHRILCVLLNLSCNPPGKVGIQRLREHLQSMSSKDLEDLTARINQETTSGQTLSSSQHVLEAFLAAAFCWSLVPTLSPGTFLPFMPLQVQGIWTSSNASLPTGLILHC